MSAVVIDLDDPQATTISEDIASEVARLRRLLTGFWSARDAGKAELANLLLEANDAVGVLDTLASELSLRNGGAS